MLLKEEKASIIENVLKNDAIPPITTPYFKFYEMEAWCEMGKLDHVREEMLSYWGGMLDLGSFLTGEDTRVVYWGTTGERIKERHAFSAFDRASLLSNGQLLLGKDVRRHLEMPEYPEIATAAVSHAVTIRQHGAGSRSIYAYGWLLDIARCLYTLVNGRLTTKTAAAQWALDEHLCPCPAELSMALTVRRQPELIRDEHVLDYAEGLTEAIRSFLNLLEQALGMAVK